jgi:hypothetical protein
LYASEEHFSPSKFSQPIFNSTPDDDLTRLNPGQFSAGIPLGTLLDTPTEQIGRGWLESFQ